MSRKSLRAVGRCIVGPPPQRGRLVRARQTAHIVAEGRDVTEVPALREVQLGAMEGLSYDDLRPEPTPEGIDVSEVRWAGGESLADVAARLRPVLEELDSCFGDYDEVLGVGSAARRTRPPRGRLGRLRHLAQRRDRDPHLAPPGMSHADSVVRMWLVFPR